MPSNSDTHSLVRGTLPRIFFLSTRTIFSLTFTSSWKCLKLDQSILKITVLCLMIGQVYPVYVQSNRSKKKLLLKKRKIILSWPLLLVQLPVFVAYFCLLFWSFSSKNIENGHSISALKSRNRRTTKRKSNKDSFSSWEALPIQLFQGLLCSGIPGRVILRTII